jgi:hypothetical protein
MGNNNGPQDLTYTFQCKGCGQSITTNMPAPDQCVFGNHPLVSSLIIPHETPTVCPKCGIAYAPILVGVQPSWSYELFEKKSESGLIIPAGGLLPFKKPNQG